MIRHTAIEASKGEFISYRMVLANRIHWAKLRSLVWLILAGLNFFYRNRMLAGITAIIISTMDVVFGKIHV